MFHSDGSMARSICDSDLKGKSLKLSEDILVAFGDGIATVTLNRPQKRNALSLAMWRHLEALFLELRSDASVRVVILTGAGGNFCAGADISEFSEVRSDVKSGRIYEDATEACSIAIRDFPLPTIAAVSGFGVGGGCGLALACDLRVGDASTQMGIPAARRGIVYAPWECNLLYRQAGLSTAKQILFSGRAFLIDECLRMGLIDIKANDALTGAKEVASEFAANAPLSLLGSKLVLEALDTSQAESKEKEIMALIDRALESQDYREGARAFLEKRQPNFKGH
jgi:enoyl-CoA hydratase/carnithine racemase